MVTGAITLSGQAPRQFAQTFFLANQKQHDKHNFYVLNDNFRLLDTIPSVLQVRGVAVRAGSIAQNLSLMR